MISGRSRASGPSRPVFFFHIAKTGGTSLAEALRRYWNPDHVLTRTVLGRELLLGARPRLRGRTLLVGHPGPGIMPLIPKKMRVVTLIRRPVDHAVSNVLHAASYPAHPLHEDAARLSLREFLARNWWQAAPQTAALLRALSEEELSSPQQIQWRLGEALALIDRLSFVGVTERPDSLARGLTRALELPLPFAFPHLNTAKERGVPEARVDELRRQFEDLRTDEVLGPVIAAEQRLYARALALGDRAEARPNGPQVGRRMWIPAERFTSETGVLHRGAWRAGLEGPRSQVIYGPFIWLPAGTYAVSFHWKLSPRPRKGRGLLEFDVLLGAVDPIVVKAWNAVQRQAMELKFVHTDPGKHLEFRIAAEGFAGEIFRFDGVWMRAR